jgi:hypothetical protein
VHCEASVSFTLGLEESRTIDVEGTRRQLDLARSASGGGLGSFTHVSTAYVAGTHADRFAEEDLELDQGFRNPYERSKFETRPRQRWRAFASELDSRHIPGSPANRAERAHRAPTRRTCPG